MIFNSNPEALAIWVHWSGKIAQQGTGEYSYHLACSKYLERYSVKEFKTTHILSTKDPMNAFGFDEADYGADLFSGINFENKNLLSALRIIEQSLHPDIVICWSQNRYIENVFPGRCVFMEHGPLPRRHMPLSSFLDPYGHQVGSSLDQVASGQFDSPETQQIGGDWTQKWLGFRRLEAERLGAKDWLDKVANGRSVTLLPLQSAGGFHYEATGPRLKPVPLLRKIAANIYEDELILPTWHSDQAVPNDDMLDVLRIEHPNIIVPEAELRVNSSEVFLQYVSRVIVISSNVAAMAAVLGLPLQVLAKCKFSRFQSSKKTKPRYDLAAFLLCRYCGQFNRWIGEKGVFESHLNFVAMNRSNLFSKINKGDCERLQQWNL